MALRIKTTFEEAVARIRDTKNRINSQTMKDILEALGVQCVSWVVQDFVTKARKGADASGTAWRDIDPKTIDNRIRKLAKYKSLKKRESKRGMLARARGKYEIGRDTGRLINSLTFGVGQLKQIRVPKQTSGQPPPRASFVLAGRSVTVGSNLSYAGYFDAARPIIPKGFLILTRRKQLEKMVADAVSKEINKAFQGGKK